MDQHKKRINKMLEQLEGNPSVVKFLRTTLYKAAEAFRVHIHSAAEMQEHCRANGGPDLDAFEGRFSVAMDQHKKRINKVLGQLEGNPGVEKFLRTTLPKAVEAFHIHSADQAVEEWRHHAELAEQERLEQQQAQQQAQHQAQQQAQPPKANAKTATKAQALRSKAALELAACWEVSAKEAENASAVEACVEALAIRQWEVDQAALEKAKAEVGAMADKAAAAEATVLQMTARASEFAEQQKVQLEEARASAAVEKEALEQSLQLLKEQQKLLKEQQKPWHTAAHAATAVAVTLAGLLLWVYPQL
jgi:hypothetical protein